MKVVFRTDASIQIGTGHVMRCLTLADALTSKGAACEFICRVHEGNLIEHIRSKGYAVHSLPMHNDADTDLAHAAWLGATQAQDVQACAPILSAIQPDWLVVDHYGLDVRWEGSLAKHCAQMMVIDDLADRPHTCQVLLDQTFGRHADDYRPLVPDGCALLCGSNYALLRPEFAELRPYSLQRRVNPKLRQLLITMGGVDKDNVTGKVLNALRVCPLPAECEITVVMGVTAPWLAEVQQQTHIMPWPTRVYIGVTNMAQLMADSDLAIGAAGATSWERCCLGLPSVLVLLAANQISIAAALSKAKGAVQLELSDLNRLLSRIPAIRGDRTALATMSHEAAKICTGEGIIYVANLLMKEFYEDYITLQ